MLPSGISIYIIVGVRVCVCMCVCVSGNASFKGKSLAPRMPSVKQYNFIKIIEIVAINTPPFGYDMYIFKIIYKWFSYLCSLNAFKVNYLETSPYLVPSSK